jgi:O-antigen ligase
MLGALAMLAVFVVTSRSLTPRNIIIGIIAGMTVLPALPSTFWERMSSITDEEKDETGSRSERIELAKRAWALFLENPLTGVGAGQFKNYGGPGEQQDWRVTHNVVLEIAAELGFFGLMAFLFLIWKGFSASLWTSRTLSWIYRKRSRRKPAPEPEDGLTEQERVFLQTHGAAMVACMAGWFVCAMFASVAFNWTFYYLLGLAVTARDIVRARAVAYARAKALAQDQELAA